MQASEHRGSSRESRCSQNTNPQPGLSGPGGARPGQALLRPAASLGACALSCLQGRLAAAPSALGRVGDSVLRGSDLSRSRWNPSLSSLAFTPLSTPALGLQVRGKRGARRGVLKRKQRLCSAWLTLPASQRGSRAQRRDLDRDPPGRSGIRPFPHGFQNKQGGELGSRDGGVGQKKEGNYSNSKHLQLQTFLQQV